MYLRSLGLGAVLALAAEAIMIPSTVSVEGLGTNLKAVSAGAHLVRYQKIKVACPTCAFKTMGEAEDVQYDLVHKLGINEDGTEFALNGAILFPPKHLPGPMYAQQVRADEDGWKAENKNDDTLKLRVNEYAAILDNPQTVSDDGFELIILTALITRIEGQSVSQAIRVQLGKDVEGRLFLLHSDFTTEPETWGLPVPQGSDELNGAAEMKQCKTWPILCQWRQFIFARIRMMKIAMKKHNFRPCSRPSRHHKPRPHHLRPHPYRHGHRRHRLHPFVKFLVIPIVAFGLGVGIYLIGWAVGSAIAFVYLFFVRGVRPRYNRVSLDDDEVETSASDHEKELYHPEDIAEVEGEAPPIYVEVAGDNVKK